MIPIDHERLVDAYERHAVKSGFQLSHGETRKVGYAARSQTHPVARRDYRFDILGFQKIKATVFLSYKVPITSLLVPTVG
jgi:hypothetical protein